jgi:hypothetical protein
MILTVDDEGRLGCPELFPPGAIFDAHEDEMERIVLTRVDSEEIPPKLVKPIRYKDGWLMPGEVDMDKLAQEIGQARLARDENPLG